MSLTATQEAFTDWLRGSDEAIHFAVPTPARCGLAVYRHAYHANLIDALRENYEKTWAWLGDEAFEAAALGYIFAAPSRSWSLGHYGEGFDAHLAKIYPDDPEIAELAWLDWALRRAFDGADSPELDREQLAQIDWDKAVLRLAPTLRLRAVVSNVAGIWNAIDAAQDAPVEALVPEPATLAVWRAGLQPCFRTVADEEALALRLALENKPFGEICAALAESEPDGNGAAAAKAGIMLASWIDEGLLAGAA